MAVLVIADHDGAHLRDSTHKTVAAATGLSGDIDVLVLGQGARAAADAAAKIAGVRKGRAAVFTHGPADETVVVAAETRLRDPEALARLERAIRERVHQVFLFGPDEVRLLPPGSIPRTTSGKVKRQECRRLFLAGELTAAPPSRGFAYGRLLRSLWRSWRLAPQKPDPKADRSPGEREPA